MKIFDIDPDHVRVVARDLAFQAEKLGRSPDPGGAWGFSVYGEFGSAMRAALAAIAAHEAALRRDYTHLASLGHAVAAAGRRVDGDYARAFAGGGA